MLNYTIAFTIKDFLYVLIVIMGVVLAYRLCFLLKELFVLFKNINSFYTDNKENLNDLINHSKNITEKTSLLMENVTDESKELIESLKGYGSIISTILNVIKSLFMK